MSAFTGRPLPDVSLEDVGTFYTPWCNFTHCEHTATQLDFYNVATVVGTVSWEFRAHNSAAPCPFQVSGSTYTVSIAAATATIGPGTGTGKLTFKSIATDATGSELSVILADTGTAGAETATLVTTSTKIEGYGTRVTERVITVAMDAGNSTAAQVKAALDGVPAIAAILSTTVSISGAMAAGVAALDGGAVFVDFTTAAPQIRAKIVVQTGAAGAFVRPFFTGKS
jgi:hypothetical protein